MGDEHVAGVPQVGGDGIGEVWVGPAAVPIGEDPQADASGFPGALGRGGHHPAQPAAEEHRASLGHLPAHFPGQAGGPGTDFTPADYRDINWLRHFVPFYHEWPLSRLLW